METRSVKLHENYFSKHPPKTVSKKSMANRFRRFIECTDWDEKILDYEKWVDGFCWGSLAVIVFCLLPAIVHIIQK
jgi:hypothetical protein